MVVVSVLPPWLAYPTRVDTQWHAAANEGSVRAHFEEIEAVHEIVEALQCLAELGILFRLAAGIADRVQTVQLIETTPAAHDELPGFHARIGNAVALVPGRIIIRLIEVDRFVLIVFVIESLQPAHLLVTAFPGVLCDDYGNIRVRCEIDGTADGAFHLLRD